jgi:glycosyltransferase involved in cell wall biosynthesis
MAALNLLVLSSRWEGFPNVVMKAMATGRRVGDMDKLVLDNETGLLVPPGCPDALAEAVISLLKDCSLAAEMGRPARISMEHDFTLS